MSAGILRPFRKGVLRWVRRLFEDPDLIKTVTYTLYQGRDEDGPITTEFSIPIVWTKDQIGTIQEEGAQIQHRIREGLLRSQDLPAGVVVSDLTVNDRITDGGTDYVIVGIDKVLGFVVKIECRGDD